MLRSLTAGRAAFDPTFDVSFVVTHCAPQLAKLWPSTEKAPTLERLDRDAEHGAYFLLRQQAPNVFLLRSFHDYFFTSNCCKIKTRNIVDTMPTPDTRFAIAVHVPLHIWLDSKPSPSHRRHQKELRWDEWDYYRLGKRKIINPPADILDQFSALVNGPPEAILTFAKSYGVLGLCWHGLPGYHRPRIERYRRTAPRKELVLRVEEGCEMIDREPIASWDALANAADALINLKTDPRATCWKAASWLSRRLGTWKKLVSHYPKGESDWYRYEKRLSGLPNSERLKILGSLIDDWLALSAMRPKTRIVGDEVWFDQFADNSRVPYLFGVLAIALALNMSSSTKMVHCHGCAKRCELAPNASLNRRHYCPECRENKHHAARADAKRALRARIREAKRLNKEEKWSPQRIAAYYRLRPRKDPATKQIISPINRVRGWLKA
jgi:hypothetical protein